jgi:outer membrane protein OmpA-like peptidoglycan-associated protein
MIIITAVAIAAYTPAATAQSSKEENIGVGSGAIIGALAGGPVGAIIGAAIGAKVGDTMHTKSAEIDALGASLGESHADIRVLHRDIDSLRAELGRYEQIDRPQLVRLMQAGIAMDLLFRTDEHVLADTTGARLADLAADVARMQDIHVKLDGFADERGDAAYNLELSKKRVDFVRQQLVAAGIDPARIQASAHGEAPAQDDTADSYALERRVSLVLFIEPENAQSVARRVEP